MMSLINVVIDYDVTVMSLALLLTMKTVQIEICMFHKPAAAASQLLLRW